MYSNACRSTTCVTRRARVFWMTNQLTATRSDCATLPHCSSVEFAREFKPHHTSRAAFPLSNSSAESGAVAVMMYWRSRFVSWIRRWTIRNCRCGRSTAVWLGSLTLDTRFSNLLEHTSIIRKSEADCVSWLFYFSEYFLLRVDD